MRTQAVRAGLLAIVVTLFAVAPTMAQEGPSTPATEGIQVHGHWIIEVFDGDEMVERREFKNALAEGGSEKLARGLSPQQTGGPWAIGFFVDADGLCIPHQVNNTGSCYDSLQPGTRYAEATVPLSGENAGSLVLVQSFVNNIQDDFPIKEVSTAFLACPSSVSADDCGDSSLGDEYFYITSKTLTSPITVETTQSVTITVILSFTG